MHDGKGYHRRIPESSFYITITNFGKVDLYVPKHQKVVEVADAPAEIVHIKHERFSYRSGAHRNTVDSSVNDVHYNQTPDLLDGMGKHESIGENDDEELNNDLA